MNKILTHIVFFMVAAILTGVVEIGAQIPTGWKKVGICEMNFIVPDTLTDEKARGIDSCIAKFRDGKMSVSLDYGHYSGISRDDSYLHFKEEKIQISGRQGRLATYRQPGAAVGHDWIARIYIKVARSENRGFGPLAMNMFVVVGSSDDLEIAKRILRSIRLDR